MSHNLRRFEILERLGVEQLPALVAQDERMEESWEAPLATSPMITRPVRPWQKVSSLCSQRPDCLGHPWKVLPSVRDRGQLARSERGVASPCSTSAQHGNPTIDRVRKLPTKVPSGKGALWLLSFCRGLNSPK
ncbi:hypothetical protein M8818_002699 [Zalaria obscura]|uniref:Uncharacterized protein n=1 Tax=Zalaria obscura TaxID=2024903 RepID=A0ACC3SHQ3_9PEZI